jgi:hypothetical protein
MQMPRNDWQPDDDTALLACMIRLHRRGIMGVMSDTLQEHMQEHMNRAWSRRTIRRHLRLLHQRGVVEVYHPRPELMHKSVQWRREQGYVVKAGRLAYAKHGYQVAGWHAFRELLYQMRVATDTDALLLILGLDADHPASPLLLFHARHDLQAAANHAALQLVTS